MKTLYDPKHLKRQLEIADPDYTVFVPSSPDYESDNVHVHVIEREGVLIAFWTQSSHEGAGDNHTMMSYSYDRGRTWGEAQFVIGAKPSKYYKDKQAHWAFPVITSSGRIYLFYIRETGYYIDYDRQTTGAFSCIYSDDGGKSWSESSDIPMRMTKYDMCAIQNNNIYQLPIRDKDGKVFMGYTKWTPKPMYNWVRERWFEADTRLYFMRFENIDDDPEPCDIKITFLPDDDNGVTLPLRDEGTDTAQEPSIVNLPDGRLLCTMRTALGYVYYTVSEDGGHNWRKPEVLTFDDGTPFIHPLAPCPIYDLGERGYVIFYTGHAENIGKSRDSVYKVFGEFDPLAHQPIKFKSSTAERIMHIAPDDPEQYPANKEKLGPLGMTAGLAMYSCHTHIDGRDVLWYPYRKFFILGKEI